MNPGRKIKSVLDVLRNSIEPQNYPGSRESLSIFPHGKKGEGMYTLKSVGMESESDW